MKTSFPVSSSTNSFSVDVLRASEHQPVLVDFWASWCGPCKMMAVPLDEIAAERTGQAVVAKVDIDAHPELAARYAVRALPTLLIFRGGAVVDALVGARPKSEILSRLDAAIAATPAAA